MSTPVPAPTHPVTALRRLVGTFPSVLLGYSGGVDSAFLAVVLRQELGRERMMAAIGRSASYPLAQWEAARALVRRFDIPLVEIETLELEDPNYVANPTNRCFYCKMELWGRLVPEARARGLAVVCDGTNADDLRGGEHRPGYAAGRSAGVRSPLAEAGMTKAQIRDASRGLGLPTWDAPAAPCLSSRVVYGLTITPERLRQVEPVARAAPRSRDRPARGSRVRGGRRGSAGLSPGQPARGRQSGLRVFLALNLPEATRQALWRATAPLRDAGFPIRWVRPEGIHLTLKFLGEVAEQRDPELAAALARTVRGARALPLALGGFGAFPDFQRPLIVWVGVAPDPSLELLQNQVE